jgi:Ca2+:H+ antiporter
MRTSCALNSVETPKCLQSTVSMLMRFTNTDAIRMKASRAASARGEDGAVNYNPFARVPSRKQSDVENHAYRTRSEAQVQPTLEEQRRLESRQTEKEFPAPHHAGTAPTVSPTSVNGTENAHHSALGKETETFGPNASASKESGEASDNTAIDHDHSTLTKRAKFKHIFRKSHDGEENEELGRVETEGLSFEERKKRAHRKKIPVGAQFRAVLLGSWINILLLAVPVGFAVFYGKVGGGPWPVFIINFIAIIPLAAMLSYATEELALRVGETLGGLLNASFGYVSSDIKVLLYVYFSNSLLTNVQKRR